MAACTAAGDAGVVVHGIAKRGGVVAIVAGVVRRRVIGRFSRRDDAVMAACAGADHFGVVDPGNRRETDGVVASFTIV